MRAKAQLDQVIEGLSVLGIYDLMKSNPSAFRKLMTEPIFLDADYIINLFITDFSPHRSNKHDMEEKLFLLLDKFCSAY